MDFDLEDLVSTDAANNAKGGAKFQPKAKPKPKPKAQPRPKSTPVVETVIAANNEHEKEQFRNYGNHVSGNINGDGLSTFEKSEGENTDVFLGLESFDDFHPQPTTITETPTIHVSMDENIEKRTEESDLRNDIDASPNFEYPAQLDPLTGKEATILDYSEVLQMGNITMGTEVAESSHFLEAPDILLESIASSEPKISKFKPKPKVQTHKVDLNAVIPNQEAVASVSFPDDILSDPSQTAFMDNGSVPSYAADEIHDLSSIRVTDSLPADAVSDFHLDIEVINLTGASIVNPAIPAGHAEGLKSTEGGNTKAHTGVGPTPEQEKSSNSNAENQAGVRTSGRLRRRTNKSLQLIDESEDEGIDDDFVLGDDDNDNNDRYEVGNESLCERNTSASNKTVAKKKQPVRKRKKASELPVESNKAAKKKFPHRTRRNKRQANPDLLKIPEDELDLQNLPMKELIRLAEHRERIAKKEASTSRTPAANQSADSFSNHYDNEAFAQGMGSAYENGHLMEGEDATYYNYGTHMKITPRVKWSKQDTELFYEAIQQFGTDLSMIKECFPGRTRAQIKSKYKKEERQHPSRLHDALTTRAKGHSHFEVVIERLKQGQGSDKDEPIDMTGEEAEEAVDPGINEEAATKPEELDKEVQDTEPNVPVGGSPMKSHDSEDEMYLWSQYKSDL